jgi:hypothetical protein
MKFIKPILDNHGKHASDFINYICDERKNLGLEKYKGENLITIDTNNGSGGKIYIDERLEKHLENYINQL